MVTVLCQGDPRVRESPYTFPHRNPTVKGLCPYNHAQTYSLLSLSCPYLTLGQLCGLWTIQTLGSKRCLTPLSAAGTGTRSSRISREPHNLWFLPPGYDEKDPGWLRGRDSVFMGLPPFRESSSTPFTAEFEGPQRLLLGKLLEPLTLNPTVSMWLQISHRGAAPGQ